MCRGSLNSALVKFENGQKEVISRNAIRKVKKWTQELEKGKLKVESKIL